MSDADSGRAIQTGNAYLLDSSVFIRSLRGDTAIAARIAGIPQAYVSSIVLGELYLAPMVRQLVWMLHSPTLRESRTPLRSSHQMPRLLASMHQSSMI